MTNDHLARSDAVHSWASPAALAVVAFGGTLATACMMPFVALAVSLALTLRVGPAIVAMTAIWAGNQLLGFGLLGYPLTGYAFAWGAALLAASLASVVVAHRVTAHALGAGATGLVLCFVTAFVAFEGLLFAFAHVAGGLETFTPGIVAKIAANDAVWFGLLLGLRLLLTRAAPRWFGTVSPVRLPA